MCHCYCEDKFLNVAWECKRCKFNTSLIKNIKRHSEMCEVKTLKSENL